MDGEVASKNFVYLRKTAHKARVSRRHAYVSQVQQLFSAYSGPRVIGSSFINDSLASGLSIMFCYFQFLKYVFVESAGFNLCFHYTL
jgi:predicted choloylglycine hydrolase